MSAYKGIIYLISLFHTVRSWFVNSEHIAPVLSVTTALDNTVVVSGGEDSRIIVTSLKTGEVVIKIDHHRGPVTAVQATAAGDILISGKS